MKILFVSTSPLEYSASSNMRNIALLNGLIQNGHKIYTLTPMADKNFKMYDDSLCDVKIEKQYYIDMGIIHSSLSKSNSSKNKIKSLIYNLLKKIKIYDFRSDLARKNIVIDEKFDILISSSDPKSSHLVAKKLIKRNPEIAKRWIQYWGDPFYDDVNDKRKFIKKIIKIEESRLIKMADKVIYVSPFTLENQKNIYNKYKDKMYFLPIPFNKEIIYNIKKNKKLKLGYFGDYYSRNRNIIPLYNSVKENKNSELIICGNSNLSLKNDSNINVFDRQQLSIIRKYEKECDVLVCICNIHGSQIPGKIYHYAATNKPILIIIDGELNEKLKIYFESFNRYILCYNNKKSIQDTLDILVKSDLKYSPCNELKSSNIASEFIK